MILLLHNTFLFMHFRAFYIKMFLLSKLVKLTNVLISLSFVLGTKKKNNSQAKVNLKI